jgi:hypothetical protein
MNKSTLSLAALFLLIGFVSSYFIFGSSITGEQTTAEITDIPGIKSNDNPLNPFFTKSTTKSSNHSGSNSSSARIEHLETELSEVKQQLQEIESTLQGITNTAIRSEIISPAKTRTSQFSSALTQRLYNLETLIRGGIDPSIAEDIVRRKNSIELKRLQLQDIATRENYLNTQQYYDELDTINDQDISLREELGDERYDEYLFNSKQNNRIRIASVMLGSAAEQAGIQKGDVVLSYDNNRMYTWQELKDATTQGQLGEFVSISIYRNGDIFSFSVPRGPLGTQLGATRLEP